MPVASKPSAAPSSASSGVFANFPQFAPELIDLPGAQETNAAIQSWWNTAKYQLLQQNSIQQQTSLKIRAEASATTGTLAAEIAEERTVRADADSALATDISTVSATLTTSIGIVAASVTTLATATATALGFLSANYSITVTAGSVVTGMQLNSSSGGGTTSSTIDFQAANFRIWDGTSTAYPIFSTSAGLVKLASTLTVNTAGKVFTGVGTYGNSNTPFYVDSSSNFSLGANLTWNGTTLTITGAITATTGTIGGWTINSTTLSKNNAVLDSAGNLLLGTSNDVVILSATDATYRIWVGNTTAASAAFAVTKAGVMSATGATLSGAGTTGNYVIIDANGFRAGSNTSTGTVNISNSSGIPYINLRYNGSVFGSWAVQSTYSSMLFSDNAGNFIAIDPRPAGGVTVAGGNIIVTGGGFYGNGANITSIDASNISSGTINNARLPSAISVSTLAASSTSGFTGLVTTNAGSGANDALLINNSGKLHFWTVGNGTYIMENNGLQLWGDGSHPVQIKGSGVYLQFGTNQALGAETVTSYIEIKDDGGTVRKLAVVS